MAFGYAIEALDLVTLDSAGPAGELAGYDLMSPYVWRQDGRIRMLVRVLRDPLGPTDPTGIIYAASSQDGLAFAADHHPAIGPGPDAIDAGGVEDPTVVFADRGEVLVFYTGVDAPRMQGSMCVARGSDLSSLVKRAVVLQAPPGEGNVKEATVARGADGRYRLFYEYALNNASRIGIAIGDSLEGPWESIADPFTIRDDSWDNWHLSTGPIVGQAGWPPVMFYNGATADARWRIGWVAFDENYTRVVARGLEPLLVPPPPQLRTGTDIAFAASCIDTGTAGSLHLYYSLEDKLLRRATVRRFD